MSKAIVIDILADASKFTKATKEATTSAQRMKSGLKGALDGLPLPFLGVAGAAALLTGELVKGVKGAIEEEAGIARLGQAMKANIPNWDGNTEAVEKAISARTDLGFADDELRDSLAKLVPATKDVNKAFDVQRTAMDLARLKGIDLVTASQALVKVEAGQYRALKDLGIVLRDGATQTEALAAVQQVAAGQAAAYMDTTAGKLENLGNKWDDLTETIGGYAIPVLDDALDVMNNLGPVIDGLTGKTPPVTDATLDFVEALSNFNGTAAIAKPLIGDLRTAYERLNTPVEVTEQSLRDFRAAERDSLKPTNILTDANRHLAGSFRLVAQTGAEALAAVNESIAWAKELGYIKASTTKPQARASGGAASGMTWVGEQGPELVNLPAGSFVHNAAQSRAMAGGPSVNVVVQGNVVGPSGIDELADMLAMRLRLDGI